MFAEHVAQQIARTIHTIMFTQHVVQQVAETTPRTILYLHNMLCHKFHKQLHTIIPLHNMLHTIMFTQHIVQLVA